MSSLRLRAVTKMTFSDSSVVAAVSCALAGAAIAALAAETIKPAHIAQILFILTSLNNRIGHWDRAVKNFERERG